MDRAPKCGVSVGAGTAARRLMVLALLLVIVCGARGLQAATVYVRAATGNDLNDGSSPIAAVRTIARGAALVKAEDRVVVGPGTYREGRIAPAPFARVSFVADRRGIETGEAPGNIVVDATGLASGFELNHNLAVTIDGFVVYGAATGIYIKSQSDQAVILNNIVSNNSGNGVYIQDSKNVLAFNNLVYNNGGSGILVTGNVSGSLGSLGVRLINNTVYGNKNRGIFIAGSTIGSQQGLVLNNIVEGNVVAGIQVNVVSRAGYVSAGNVAGFARGTPVDPTDIRTSKALFVGDDHLEGPDGMLGGAGYADDDFHLSQVSAGQSMTSPAVDTGSDLARLLKLARSTTRSDGRPDRGWVDAGYHYRNFDAPPPRPQLRLRFAPLYVNPTNGVDRRDGGSAATPLMTIAQALELAQPGNCIILEGATYHEGQLTFARSGKPGRRIIIQGRPGTQIDATGFDRGFLISNRSHITLVGLDVSGAADSGIEIRNGSSDVTVLRCHLHQNGRRGVYVNGTAEITVQAGTIESNGTKGVQVTAGQLDVVRSTIMANGEEGLSALSGSTVALDGSQFLDNMKSGVLADQSSVTMTDSVVSGNKDGGVRFNPKSTGLLTRVVLLNNRDFGVQGISSVVNLAGGRVEGSTRVGVEGVVDAVSQGINQLTLTGTRVCGNQGLGVRAQSTAVALTDVTLCANADDGLRQSNGVAQILRATVTGNQGKGISITGGAQFVLRDSTITDNGDHGLHIATTAAPIISHAVVSRNAGNGLWALAHASVAVSDSQFADNAKSGILVDQSGMTITDSTISGNPDGGVRLTNGSNGALTRIVVSNNTDVGVQSISSTVSIAGGRVEGNARLGIEAFVDALRSGPSQLTVSAARVCDNQGPGLRAQDTAVTLTDATLCGNSQEGLRQTGGSTQILRALVTQNQGRGLSVSDANQFALQDSTVSDNGDSGVQLVTVKTAALDRVTLSANQGNGLWVTNGSVVAASNGQLTGNTKSGALVDQSILMVGDTTISGNQDGGARVLNGSSATFANVVLSNNTDAGLQGISSSMSMSGGAIEGNTRLGIETFVDSTYGGTSQLGLSGTRVCNNQGPGVRPQDTAVSLTDVTLCRNAQEGLRQSGGTVQIVRAVVSENGSKGLAVSGASQLLLQDAAVANNRDNGVQVAATAGARITGSVVDSNSGDGLTILDSSSATIVNNLIYANTSTGIMIAGDTVGSPSAQVLNNTIFGNRNRGLVIGGSDDKPQSSGAMVLRNVFQGNSFAGLQVNQLSLPGYVGDYNLNVDPYGGLVPGAHDLLTDPALVRPENGDFHLSQRPAGQGVSSPAVDAGGIDVAAAGLQETTTRTDGVADTGAVDLGYHYRQ